MEMSMYQDNDNEKSQQLRKGMHLDFESNKTKQQKFSSMLNNSSDMLKLSSPEDLDKLMSHSHSSVVGTTPTPTSFIYPKYVTDEQEAYARGFVEALAELHQSPAMSSGSQSATTNTASSSSNQVGLSLNAAKPTYSTLMPMSTQSTFVSPYNTAQGTVASSMTMMNPTVSRRHPPFAPSGLAAHNALSQPPHIPPHNMQMPSSHPYAPAVHVKSEPSTSFTDHQVPRSPGGASSRMTESPSAETDEDNYDRVENVNRLDSIPVDLEEQEKIKLERKRARNRIAARKCRTRKLERIGRLEEKVADLKSRNNELAQTANSLSDQVMQLKQQIMEHMKSGCQIMMPDMRPMPTGY